MMSLFRDYGGEAMGVAQPLTTIAIVFGSMLFWHWFCREEVLLQMERETILITGGAGGLGSSLARAFLAEKCKSIILWDIDPTALAKVKDELIKAGGSASSGDVNHIIAQTVDLSSLQSIQKTCEDLRAQDIHPTVLVNNAGIVVKGRTDVSNDASVVKAFEVNAFAHLRLNKILLPDMIEKNHGTIVTIASVTAHLGFSGSLAYSGSKAAATMFHEVLVQELSHMSGIRTIICKYGRLNTRMFKDMRMTFNELLTLDTEPIAQEVVQKVKSRFEGTITRPFLYHLWPIYASLPLRLRVFVANMMAGNTSMVDVKESPL